MSLDNVLGVAGAAGHHYHLLIFGLVLSIILMAVAANLISLWIKKPNKDGSPGGLWLLPHCFLAVFWRFYVWPTNGVAPTTALVANAFWSEEINTWWHLLSSCQDEMPGCELTYLFTVGVKSKWRACLSQPSLFWSSFQKSFGGSVFVSQQRLWKIQLRGLLTWCQQKNTNEASRNHGTENIGGFFINGGNMFNTSRRHKPGPGPVQSSSGPTRSTLAVSSPGPAQAWPRPGLEIWKIGIQKI